MNARGRRTQQRAQERQDYKARQAKLRNLQRSYRPKRKIKNFPATNGQDGTTTKGTL